MDYKIFIYILLAIAIIIAIISKDKVKTNFMGLKLQADNIFRRNRANIKGDENVVEHTGSKGAAGKSTTNIKGNRNKVKLG